MTNTHPAKPDESTPLKLGRVKQAFLYVLVGSLVVSALIAISAILVGEFTTIIQKALWTTFIFMVHSLLILAIVLADTKNQLGRDIVATTILGAVFANMFTMTFGVWELWSGETSWRAFYFYMLAIGTAFLLMWLGQLRIAHKLTRALVGATATSLSLWALLLIPWIFVDTAYLGDFYFRLVSALTVLTATLLIVTTIFRGIAVSQHPALRATAPAKINYPGSMLSVIITIGSFTALLWFIGVFVFLASASYASGW